MNRADVAIIGGGVMGVCTALALRERGLSVVLYEEGEPGHSRASSGGLTRLIRYEYGGDPVYHDLVAESWASWRRFERRLGERFLVETPAVFLEPEDRAWDWEERSRRFLARRGFPVERLTPARLARRAPLMSVEGVRGAVWDAKAGMLFASHAVRRLASSLGPVVVRRRIKRVEDAYARAGAVVVCAGPYVTELLPGMRRFIRCTRQVIGYYDDRRFDHGRFPVFADLGRGYYGMPGLAHPDRKAVAGGRVPFKVGFHEPVEAWDPRDASKRRLFPADVERLDRYVAQRFPALAGRRPDGFEVCTYAMTASPDGDWILGRLPGRKPLFAACGFSGHGFKFGPAIGQHLAAMVAAELGGGRVPAASHRVLDRFSPRRARPHRRDQ